MKNTLLKYTPTTVIINQGGTEHSFKRTGAMLVLLPEDIETMTEAMSLILVFLAQARKFYLEKRDYLAIRGKIWTLIDRVEGGLNEAGLVVCGEDSSISEAANIHRKAIADQNAKRAS